MQANDIVYTVLPFECFFCVSLLLVPFHSRWFHLETSEMVFFATIAILNIDFYWAMALYAQSCPINFMFFISVCCWVHLVSGGSTLFQVVPLCFRWFQLIQGSCSSFQVVQTCSILFLVLVCMQILTFLLRYNFSASKHRDY